MWPFKKKKAKEQKIDMNNLPRHIAFIADGNGRWAQKRGLPRSEGHKVGEEAIQKVLQRCSELGIKVASFYCFSTENFKRPKEEVEYIFNLFRKYRNKIDEYKDKGIQVRLMGDISLFPDDLQEILTEMVEKTKNCDKLIFNFGFGYGSRHEIIGAINQLLKEKVEVITEEEFDKYLYTNGLPDPDLIVRASGEQRLSNFMLYQAAYSEFYFPETHWPDFNADVVDECVLAYQKRKRRFGKI